MQKKGIWNSIVLITIYSSNKKKQKMELFFNGCCPINLNAIFLAKQENCNGSY